jgi:ADP-heptose:LPS heptosyltransferase
LRSLGDVALLTPALAALHAWRPDLRLVVLVEPAYAAVLEGHPAVAEVLLYRGFLPTVWELRRRRFPVTFNQHGGPTSALLTAGTGSPARVGWADRQFGFLYSVLAPGPEHFYGRAQVHTVEHRLTQFYAAGLPRGPIPPMRVFPQADAAASVARTLAERSINAGAPYAAIHPGAAFFTRRWPVARFVGLVRWLREQALACVVILGPGDAEIAADVHALLAKDAVVLEQLALRELIALLAAARLYIGHDTGPTHLAVAAGRPVVMIFGASTPVLWRPWQVPHRVVQNLLPCNPCPGDRCYAFAQPECILSVTFDQVRDACQSILVGDAPVVPGPRG